MKIYYYEYFNSDNFIFSNFYFRYYFKLKNESYVTISFLYYPLAEKILGILNSATTAEIVHLISFLKIRNFFIGFCITSAPVTKWNRWRLLQDPFRYSYDEIKQWVSNFSEKQICGSNFMLSFLFICLLFLQNFEAFQ